MVTGSGAAGKKYAAAISVAAVLLTAAACGDEKGSDSGSKPLSRARLSSAALAQGDVANYTITEVSASTRSARAVKKSCQPIINAMYPEVSAYDKRLAGRSLVKTSENSQKPTAAYRLVLSSAKSESAAEQSVKALKSAIAACGSGFDTNLSGLGKKIRSVTANKSSFGDDGVDFSLEFQIGRKVRYAMVQHDASLISVSAEDEFAHTFVAVPNEIVNVQKRKLDKAAK
jgi:hypothetical protein